MVRLKPVLGRTLIEFVLERIRTGRWSRIATARFAEIREKIGQKLFNNPKPLEPYLKEVLKHNLREESMHVDWHRIYAGVKHVNYRLVGISTAQMKLTAQRTDGLVYVEGKYVYLTKKGETLWPRIEKYYYAHTFLEAFIEEQSPEDAEIARLKSQLREIEKRQKWANRWKDPEVVINFAAEDRENTPFTVPVDVVRAMLTHAHICLSDLITNRSTPSALEPPPL